MDGRGEMPEVTGVLDRAFFSLEGIPIERRYFDTEII
jgi:hypothetical protein